MAETLSSMSKKLLTLAESDRLQKGRASVLNAVVRKAHAGAIKAATSRGVGRALFRQKPKEVRGQLRTSGALLHVVSTAGAQRPPASSARQGISTEQAQNQDADNASSIQNLGQVLGDGAKESGGRHDQVLSQTLVPALERIADEFLNQYAIACALPEGVKLTDKLSVSTTRKDVKLQFADRLPRP